RSGPALSLVSLVTRTGCLRLTSTSTIPSSCSGVFPSPYTTSGKPKRTLRWVSTVAYPSSTKGRSTSARVASSTVARPRRTSSSSFLSRAASTSPRSGHLQAAKEGLEALAIGEQQEAPRERRGVHLGLQHPALLLGEAE